MLSSSCPQTPVSAVFSSPVPCLCLGNGGKNYNKIRSYVACCDFSIHVACIIQKCTKLKGKLFSPLTSKKLKNKCKWFCFKVFFFFLIPAGKYMHITSYIMIHTHTHVHTNQDLLQSLNSLEANRIKVDINRCERGDDFSLQFWHFGNSQQPEPSGQLTKVQICAAANKHNGHNVGISKDAACTETAQ